MSMVSCCEVVAALTAAAAAMACIVLEASKLAVVDAGGWSRSPSRSKGRSDADFNDSMAATAASSSGTNGSSVFSSERTRTIVACFRGGEAVGDTTGATEAEEASDDSDTEDSDGCNFSPLCDSSKDRCDSKETQLYRCSLGGVTRDLGCDTGFAERWDWGWQNV